MPLMTLSESADDDVDHREQGELTPGSVRQERLEAELEGDDDAEEQERSEDALQRSRHGRPELEWPSRTVKQ